MNTTPANRSPYAQGRAILAMWVAIAAAPLAWALHLNVGYALAALVCTPALDVWLYGFSAFMFALAVGGTVACRRLYRDTREAAKTDLAAARTHFLAGTGLLGGLLLATAIAAQTIPIAIFPPC